MRTRDARVSIVTTLATILIVDHSAMTWQVLETHQKYRTPGGIARRLGPEENIKSNYREHALF